MSQNRLSSRVSAVKWAHSLKALLGLAGIVAARLLQMSKGVDQHPQALAYTVFPTPACEVLARHARLNGLTMTVSQFRM